MPPIFKLTLAALLSLCVTAPAWAQWRDIPYADITKMPLGLKGVDPQGIYTCTYIARPAEGKTSLPVGLQLQIKLGSQIIPVAIAADGRVAMPFRQDWADAGAVVQVNQPKGSFRMSLDMNPRTPAGTRMSYAQLTESALVLERGIKQMAGMLSLFAPKVKTFTLNFSPGAVQTATLTWPGGKKKLWKSSSDGKLSLPWEPNWANVLVELSAPLKEVGPEVK